MSHSIEYRTLVDKIKLYAYVIKDEIVCDHGKIIIRIKYPHFESDIFSALNDFFEEYAESTVNIIKTLKFSTPIDRIYYDFSYTDNVIIIHVLIKYGENTVTKKEFKLKFDKKFRLRKFSKRNIA